MGAPFGNQNAVGHGCGRPPEPHNPTDEELEVLGREMIEWTNSEEFKSAVHLDEFALCKKGLTWRQWKKIIVRVNFKEYYETARQKMAFNLLRNKDMHDSMGNRYLCFYDRDLHAFEEENRDRAANRGKEEKVTINADQLKAVADCLARFNSKSPSKDTADEENHSE